MKEYVRKEKLEVGYYLIAFIDVLGQAENLRKFRELPETEEEKQAFIKILRETFGTVDLIRSAFDNFFKAYNEKRDTPLPMTEEKKKIFNELRECEIHSQRFGDTILIYTSLRAKKGHRVPIQAIYSVLAACSSIFMMALATKHIMRGSVEVGLAAEMSEEEIYGPVLFEAYRLESKVAQYPRIVIGEQLVNYLTDMANLQSPELVNQLTKKTAQTCLGLIAQDFDGNYILDYMGKGIRDTVILTFKKPELESARQFLFEQADRWKAEKNTTLASRYALMIGYFLSRLPFWQDSP